METRTTIKDEGKKASGGGRVVLMHSIGQLSDASNHNLMEY